MSVKVLDTLGKVRIQLSEKYGPDFNFRWLESDCRNLILESSPPMDDGWTVVAERVMIAPSGESCARQKAFGAITAKGGLFDIEWNERYPADFYDGNGSTLQPGDAVWIGADYGGECFWTENGRIIKRHWEAPDTCLAPHANNPESRLLDSIADRWQEAFELWVYSGPNRQSLIDWASFHSLGICIALASWHLRPEISCFYETPVEDATLKVPQYLWMSESDLPAHAPTKELLLASCSLKPESRDRAVLALEAGAKPGEPSFFGMSPATVAARLGNHWAVGAMADFPGTAEWISRTDAFGSSPLCSSIWGANHRIVRILQQLGARAVWTGPSLHPFVQLCQVARCEWPVSSENDKLKSSWAESARIIALSCDPLPAPCSGHSPLPQNTQGQPVPYDRLQCSKGLDGLLAAFECGEQTRSLSESVPMILTTSAKAARI